MINNIEKIQKDISSIISRGASYIDALVEYSKANGIEIETIGEMVKKSPNLKQRVKIEAEKLKLIKEEEKSQLENFMDE